MSENRKYRLHPEAEILYLDTSLEHRMYQLRLGEMRYRINESTLAFLRQFEEERNEQELDNALENVQIANLDASGLKDFFIQRQILITDPISELQKLSGRKHPLALRLPLFSQRQLQPLTRPLATLFSRRITPLLIAFIVLSHTLFLYYARPLLHSVPRLAPQQWIAAIIACYCLMLVHELGHSSACTRYGARHEDIGIGIYFIYPVFYANVTDCWRLPRYQRAVVDVAGIYFQLLASGLCGLFWIYNHHPVELVLVLSSLATVLANLNPFLRFDGYWLLTDITALPSLHNSNQELWRFWWAKLWHKSPAVRRPEFFSASAWVKTVFVLYSACSLSFFAVFFGRLGMTLIPHLIYQVPKTFVLVWQMLIAGQFNAALLSVALRLAGLSITSFGVVMMVRGLGRRTFRLILRVYSEQVHKPHAEPVEEQRKDTSPETVQQVPSIPASAPSQDLQWKPVAPGNSWREQLPRA